MKTTLDVLNISYGYPGQKPILSEVSLKVTAGERVGLIGPNGAGKTTLFLLICGILSPIAGKIEVMQKPVKPGDFLPEVGMVFQHTNDQLICPTVRDDIAFGPQNMGLPEDEIGQRIMRAVGDTGIAALLERPPHQLSSGEQRLVALSGILAMEPQLLIMDEPTSDLDMGYRRRLIRLLLGFTEKTMLIASHDLEFLLETCTRVILLEGSQVQADGEPAVVMGKSALMEKHGLEVPHSLMAAWHKHRGE